MAFKITPTPAGIVVIFPSEGPQTGLILVLPISGVAEIDAPGFASSPVVYDCLVFLIACLSDLNPEDRLQPHRADRHFSRTRLY